MAVYLRKPIPPIRGDSALLLLQVGFYIYSCMVKSPAASHLPHRDRTAESRLQKAARAIEQRDFEGAAHHIEKARQRGRLLHDGYILAAVLHQQGVWHAMQLEHTAALQQFSKAMLYWKKHKQLTEGANTLVSMANVCLRQQQLTKAQLYIDKALAIGRSLADAYTTAKALNAWGPLLSTQSKFTEAVQVLQEAVRLFGQINAERELASANLHLGNQLHRLGDDEAALLCYLTALRIRQKLALPYATIPLLNNIGAIYQSRKDYKSAAGYFRQSLELSTLANDRPRMANTLTNLGKVLTDMKQYTHAHTFLQEAETMLRHLNLPHEQMAVYHGQGNLHNQLKKHTVAQLYFEQALMIARAEKHLRMEGISLFSLGQTLCALHNYRTAKKYLQQATSIAKKISDLELLYSCHEEWSTVEDLLGNPKAALRQHRLYVAAHQKHINVESERHLQRLQMQYDIEQKQQQIAALQQAHEGFTQNPYHLSPREQQTLAHLVAGLSYKQVAAQMNVGYETVRGYVKSIYKKMGVGTNTEAVAKAIKEKLV